MVLRDDQWERIAPLLPGKAGVFDEIFAALSNDADFEYALIDGTIVRVRQHGTGARGGLRFRPSVALVAG